MPTKLVRAGCVRLGLVSPRPPLLPHTRRGSFGGVSKPRPPEHILEHALPPFPNQTGGLGSHQEWVGGRNGLLQGVRASWWAEAAGISVPSHLRTPLQQDLN